MVFVENRPVFSSNESLASKAKAKGEVPPGGVRVPVPRKESPAMEAMEASLSRCYLALNTIGMTPPPEDVYEYTRWQFQVSAFGQRARPLVPDGIKDKNAMDLGSVGPHRNTASKSIRRGPYQKGKVDEATKPGPSKDQEAQLMAAFRELKFDGPREEVIYYRNWPGLLASHGAKILKLNADDPQAFGFKAEAVQVKEIQGVLAAEKPTENQQEILMKAAAFYFNKQVLELLVKTKVKDIRHLWGKARPQVAQLEKEHRLARREVNKTPMDKMDLSK